MIKGARAVGEGSIWLNGLLFAPFVALIVIALARRSAASLQGHPSTAGISRAVSCRHVELHGLGQYVDGRRGGRPPPDDLSPGHVRLA